jgi:general stress protein 26
MDSTEIKKIVAIMRKNSSPAYLATCDEDQPRVRPVSPIVEDDLTVWVATSSNSRKVKQIKGNSKICLSFMEHPEGDRSAFVIGEAEIIPDLDKKKRVWKLANFDLSQYFPKGPESDEFCLLKIHINKIEWWESWESGTNIYEPTRE